MLLSYNTWFIHLFSIIFHRARHRTISSQIELLLFESQSLDLSRILIYFQEMCQAFLVWICCLINTILSLLDGLGVKFAMFSILNTRLFFQKAVLLQYLNINLILLIRINHHIFIRWAWSFMSWKVNLTNLFLLLGI